MKKKPYIGITLDHETSPTYSQYPWYALRDNYSQAVAKAGGIPIMLPYHAELVKDYLSVIDGLILTGGNFDVPPEFYGETVKSDKVNKKSNRSYFEFEIAKAAINSDLPVLGICGGEQLLNVVAGGTLVQHIPDEIKNCLIHEQPAPKHLPSHNVTVEKSSKLFEITSSLNFKVNSTHHQAVKTLGNNVIISATADDGVIEAIEFKKNRFAIGVQWHPEYLSTEEDRRLFAAFIEASQTMR